MAGESEENGAEYGLGGAAAGGGATANATSAASNKVGSGGLHGEIIRVRERVSGRQENPDGESSGVGGERGGARPAEWLASPPE